MTMGIRQTRAPPPLASRTPMAMPPLLGDRLPLREALATKRAVVAALGAAWVTAVEADAVRNTSRDVRIDDRGTWGQATW